MLGFGENAGIQQSLVKGKQNIQKSVFSRLYETFVLLGFDENVPSLSKGMAQGGTNMVLYMTRLRRKNAIYVKSFFSVLGFAIKNLKYWNPDLCAVGLQRSRTRLRSCFWRPNFERWTVDLDWAPRFQVCLPHLPGCIARLCGCIPRVLQGGLLPSCPGVAV